MKHLLRLGFALFVLSISTTVLAEDTITLRVTQGKEPIGGNSVLIGKISFATVKEGEEDEQEESTGSGETATGSSTSSSVIYPSYDIRYLSVAIHGVSRDNRVLGIAHVRDNLSNVELRKKTDGEVIDGVVSRLDNNYGANKTNAFQIYAFEGISVTDLAGEELEIYADINPSNTQYSISVCLGRDGGIGLCDNGITNADFVEHAIDVIDMDTRKDVEVCVLASGCESDAPQRGELSDFEAAGYVLTALNNAKKEDTAETGQKNVTIHSFTLNAGCAENVNVELVTLVLSRGDVLAFENVRAMRGITELSSGTRFEAQNFTADLFLNDGLVIPACKSTRIDVVADIASDADVSETYRVDVELASDILSDADVVDGRYPLEGTTITLEKAKPVVNKNRLVSIHMLDSAGRSELRRWLRTMMSAAVKKCVVPGASIQESRTCMQGERKIIRANLKDKLYELIPE